MVELLPEVDADARVLVIINYIYCTYRILSEKESAFRLQIRVDGGCEI